MFFIYTKIIIFCIYHTKILILLFLYIINYVLFLPSIHSAIGIN